jgi:hypothetical protein
MVDSNSPGKLGFTWLLPFRLPFLSLLHRSRGCGGLGQRKRGHLIPPLARPLCSRANRRYHEGWYLT